MKLRIKKLIGRLYGKYCYKCGNDLWFDQEKWDLGYRTGEQCTNPDCSLYQYKMPDVELDLE